MTVTRRLAAILAADVVGYSRLMEADEAGTLAALRTRRRDVLEPLVTRHQGRVFKVTGDGVLIEFASAVNAVQCAVDLQQAFAAANIELSGEHQIVLRIGVNLGDVMVEGSDLYGDGINIAARLESLADHGGILVSGTTYDYVRNKVKVGFDDLGTQALKNIAEPVRAYRVTGTPAVPIAPRRASTDEPSLVVLPFINMSEDIELEHVADGLTEDIITALSRASRFVVIARTSAFAYKGKVADVKRIAQELNSNFVIEGSVRRAGDRVRVTAQLIDAQTGHHIWAEKYDGPLAEVFNLQDRVTQAIAASAETQVILARGRGDPAGGDTRAKARVLAERSIARAYDQTPDAYSEALDLAEQAIALDPGSSLAHLAKAGAYLASLELRLIPPTPENFQRSIELGRLAVSMAPREVAPYSFLGGALREAGRHEEAIAALEAGLQFDPNFTLCYSELAVCYLALGRAQEAIASAETVLRLNPRDPTNHWMHYVIAGAQFLAGDYERAVIGAKRVSLNRPEFARPALIWAAAAAALDRQDEAAIAVAHCLSVFPAIRVGNLAPDYIARFARSEDQSRIEVFLRKAGLPE